MKILYIHGHFYSQIEINNKIYLDIEDSLCCIEEDDIKIDHYNNRDSLSKLNTYDEELLVSIRNIDGDQLVFPNRQKEPSFDQASFPYIWGGKRKGNFSVGTCKSAKNSEEEKNFIFDWEQKKSIELDSNREHESFDQEVATFRDKEVVVAYDMTGKQLWSYTTKNRWLQDSAIHETQFFKELAILLLGEDEKSGYANGEIIALNKWTGECIWSFKADQRIGECLLIEDRVYLSIGSSGMVVLSAKEGKVLLNQNIEIDVSEELFLNKLWTDQKALYYIMSAQKKILVFTMDGQTLLREITIPNHLSIKDSFTPFTFKGKNYLPLEWGSFQFVGAEGGLLTWDYEDIENNIELELEEPPEMSIEAITKRKNGPEAYQLTITSNDLNKIIRFAEGNIKHLGMLRGRQLWENEETINKKFNGKITLILNSKKWDSESETKLNALIERVNDFFDCYGIYSGNGKKVIQADWRYSD